MAAAFRTFPMISEYSLDVRSFVEHRQNLGTLAMKGARSHRGRFKTAVLKALYETKEFGITPKTSATSVASRVEALLRHDRFLDATIPSASLRVPGSSMYKSPILKKAVQILYTTEPWYTAISQPWFTDIEDSEQSFKMSPPAGFVAFAACAFHNVLDSLASGTEETVQFREDTYSPIYERLLELVKADMDDFHTGLVVSANIQAFIVEITI
ncbi:hypothetical protein BJ322DRAFT_1071707 [Thelephora terrestris]|uniref:DUF6532 domain-containing protein n=1 Tax=Thelephora terrestris TaxID=56493 RepID=A0A9P6L531_9AGAM|nr:hypothetical protein BJ322DRAFT_1071707 [Thelephora terrestris]